ncbi:MAG TPA: zinc ribbon domain-containing protein [Spirochaetota bacterium]|nr:zinc ribbon domain-containing protein [Spirochaetota bacterium]
MPVYEYLCKDCSHQFEKLVRGYKESTLCPQCNSRKVSKLFSTFACRGTASPSESASSGCSSCSGGNCASCH